mgnify:CR=1 FL=1
MTASPASTVRAWAVELVATGLVLALGLVELASDVYVGSRLALLVVLLVVVGAVASFRRLPGLALGLVWFVALVHVLGSSPVMLVEVVAVTVIAFGCGRWGRPATLVLSALSIPAACAGALLLALTGRIDLFSGLTAWVGGVEYGLYYLRTGTGVSWLLPVTAVAGLAILGLPWLTGVALRMADRADAEQRGREVAEADSALARTQAEQAEEIARLREQQTRLANDVHDVVGHSLAVILAQAESAQYADGADGTDGPDSERLRATMATIAESARTSLHDVRSVLAQGQAGAPPAEAPQLDALVEGVRRAGHEVVVHDEGAPRPLPPELATVAARVLQEMLTNAIRHGRQGSPVHVDRHWGDPGSELRLEVANLAPAVLAGDEETRPIAASPGSAGSPDSAGSPAGSGLPGMRRRLESVGGRLDVRRRTGDAGTTWTVTAWIPTRGGR